MVQLDPPHRASRYFRHSYKMCAIHRDAFGILRRRGKNLPFFLEWERRAVRPSTIAARLAPYLRYYSSHDPTDGNGAYLLVLIVFGDVLVESRFLGIARREIARTRVGLPLWMSHRETLERVGPLGKAWRSPEVLAPARPFAGAEA